MRINEVIEPRITTAYHITTVENAEEILYVGLEPRPVPYNPGEHRVFLVADTGDKQELKKELETVAGHMYAKTEQTDEQLTLLQVDVSGIPLEYYNGYYTTTNTIPANRIKNLGPEALSNYY